MGVVPLLRAVLLAAIAGFLEGHRSGWLFLVAVPFAFAAVFAHVRAAAWPVGERPVGGQDLLPGPGLQSEHEPLLRGRKALGVVAGLTGLVWGFGYQVNHQAWFGERVTAVVTEVDRQCDDDCSLVYRLTKVTSGDDLGWIELCDASVARGSAVAVVVDPLGWVKPLAPACAGELRHMLWFTYVWLGAVGGILVLRVGAAVWMWQRANRGADATPSS